MQSLYYSTVIIGSGFAARVVADYLPEGSYIIVERGENRDYGEIRRRFEQELAETGDHHKAENKAYGSDLPWNTPPQLSRWNYSKYAMVRGGASNWWGGNTRRCSPATFMQKGPISWPLSYEELVPWYEKAEKRLGVVGDIDNHREPPALAMPGAEYWRTAFHPYFQNTHLSNVALNRSTASSAGLCKGRSQCTICYEDAKLRPDNCIPNEPNALYGTMAMELLFDGDRARGVRCYDGRQIFDINCGQVVVAANGIETPRIFGRSELPPGVRRHAIGRYYQDHGHLHVYCKLPKPLAYGNVGGLSHVHLSEISTYYGTELGQIEASAFALTHEPSLDAFAKGIDLDILRSAGPHAFLKDLAGCFEIFCELEVPPEANFAVDISSDEPRIQDESYEKVIAAFDDVTAQICRKITICGVEVLGVNPKYRVGYNSHHLSGTMSCSDGPDGVVDRNLKVIGTENVYVSGSAVMPRAGGNGPTLTIVALAERLGTHLAGAYKND